LDAYTIDKARVRAAFDRAAPQYDAAAVLQREVRARMLQRLDVIRIQPRMILDAGTGTGQAAQGLAARYRDARVIALDIALGMLRVAAGTQPWWRRFAGRRQFELCADLEHLPLAAGSMDMIWSNLAVQWCNDLDRVFADMARVLRPEGLLTFSTFGPDTLKELREAGNADPEHVHVSRFIDMHDIGDALVRAGFADPVLDVEHFVLTYDDVLAVMRDLKSIGAHNAAQGRRRGLEGKSFLRNLEQRYEQFRSDGKLPATFEVVYAHAWKGQERLPDGAVPIRIHRRK
jgi:malonyl-CoA O-methyltransferase